jgi:hypothetical protein
MDPAALSFEAIDVKANGINLHVHLAGENAERQGGK